MKHVKHGKKLISLLLSAAVAMSMTLSTVMTPLAASSSVRLSRKRSTSSSRTRRATRPTLRLSKRSLSSRRH